MSKVKRIFVFLVILGMGFLLLASAEAAILLTKKQDSNPHLILGPQAREWMIAILPDGENQAALPTLHALPVLQEPDPLPTFLPTRSIQAQPTMPGLTITPVFAPLATYTPWPASTPGK